MRIAHVALLWMVVLLAGLCPPASAQPFVGVVKSVEGGVTVERHGQKAIIASGYAPSDRVKDLETGGDIRKPFPLEKIGLAVRREPDRQ